MGTYCDFEGNNLIDFLIKKKKKRKRQCEFEIYNFLLCHVGIY